MADARTHSGRLSRIVLAFKHSVTPRDVTDDRRQWCYRLVRLRDGSNRLRRRLLQGRRARVAEYRRSGSAGDASSKLVRVYVCERVCHERRRGAEGSGETRTRNATTVVPWHRARWELTRV
ncbi:uncharacterized protein LOC105195643 [Solenopsis invicta]|uniref:uncharacterized protein LOC105195643 n=1 Tax=Solenopsis invicta TaxID=13686 RepID=UPI000E33EF81|nr:uncharacterized protein LOC105195643 [Solenopsis invicta]